MKILSNFDTQLSHTLLQEYTAKYGNDSVLLISKSKLYYYQYIGIPWFGYLVLLCIGFVVYYTLDTLPLGVEIVFWSIYSLLAILISRKTFGAYINYKMDFLLVTPEEIIKYDQQGLFGRTVEKLQASKIKSITIDKHGMINSFFDLGSLHIMAEGNTEKGDIIMRYVDAIEYKERKMLAILNESTK